MHVNQFIESNTRNCNGVMELGAGDGARLEFAPRPRLGLDVAATDNPDVVYEDMLHYQVLQEELKYECVMLIDSLEHLFRWQGEALLEQLKRDFKCILIFCPLGWHEQHDPDNDFNTHRSAWVPQDFIERGFSVTVDEHYHCDNPPEKQGAIFATWRR